MFGVTACCWFLLGSVSGRAVDRCGWTPGSCPALVDLAALRGVGYGGWIALQPTVIAELFGLRSLGGLVGLVHSARDRCPARDPDRRGS